MKVTITAKKLTINQSFTDYATQKLSAKLDRFFPEEAEAKITLEERRELIILELTVKYNGIIYRAEQSAKDKNDALDVTVDRVIRQIRKQKTKVEKSLRTGAFEGLAPEAEEKEYEVMPMTRMRQIIGKRMKESLTNIPCWQCTTSIKMDACMALRAAYKDKKGVKLSYNDIMAKAIAVASRKFPLVNARYEEDEVRVYKHTNVGLAVALDGALIVPVVKEIDAKGLEQIAGDYKEQLTDLLWNQLMADNKVATRQELEDMGYVTTGDLTPTENFYLSKDGITFYYNVYDIAPYVMGPVKITLPYEMMQHLLSDETMALNDVRNP